jgi:hypothetical protein
LFAAPALDSGAGPVRVLPVERAPGLSLDPEPDPARGLDPDDEPPPLPEPDDVPPPRETALPLLPPPLGPDDRGVALWPSSEYDIPLLKPSRCRGANSRELDPIDGDEIALADGELKLAPPPPLEIDPPETDPPPELATLPPPPLEPPLPRSTAPPLLDAPPPVDRSAAPADEPLSDGRACPNAGVVASVKLATTIPSLILKAFICAPLCSR